jgi:hypothetical protein
MWWWSLYWWGGGLVIFQFYLYNNFPMFLIYAFRAKKKTRSVKKRIKKFYCVFNYKTKKKKKKVFSSLAFRSR